MATFSTTRGTGYNLLNAVTEYTDHVQRVDDDQKRVAESVMFGAGEARKEEALEVILETTKGNPLMKQVVYSKPGRPATKQPAAPVIPGKSILDQIVAQQ